jgi:galactose oxidase-like protein/fibronectin type III domain protein
MTRVTARCKHEASRSLSNGVTVIPGTKVARTLRRTHPSSVAAVSKVRWFVLLLGGLGAVGSCHDDERSATGVARAVGSAAIVAAAQTSSAVIRPTGDTYLNVNAANYATDTLLNLYTWPSDTIANAIVMTFDLTSIPAGATISSAMLNLYLAASDPSPDPTYTVTVHGIVNKNPDVTRATGYTYDGVSAWTPNACCRNHIPLAQSDIGVSVDTRDVDKAIGFKQWDVTSIVQGWLSDPSTNFGLLMNSDPSKVKDRYRFFRSNEDPVTSRRPSLAVTFVTAAAASGAPGTVADLAVETRSDNTITLGFTEVDDGTGNAATYDVRYATSPIGENWESAPAVTQGTCSTPVAGTTLGAHRSCGVEGLSPGTTYDFQMVAYRGTLNQDATFGGLSNVATGTTTSADGAPGVAVGQWSAVVPTPFMQIHLHLLPNAKVLTWGFAGDPQVWDPATGGFTAVPAPSVLFCAGHDFLPDGRLLVTGGHISNDHGLPDANVFDAATGSWHAAPAMARGRWYPTTTTLPDGQVLTIAGTDQGGAVVTIPEVWNGTSWRPLTTASRNLPYYPRMFVAPDGRVFYAGHARQSLYLSVTGTGSWTNGPVHTYPASRDYGSAVMYEPGKILYVGGGDPPTNTAEIIDLNQPTPAWQYTGSMAVARRQINATLLPNGDVLVTGGTSGSGFNNRTGAVHAAELWNPSTGTWTTLASNAITRTYHSTTLLLPDGRVLHAGQDVKGYELFSPSYLFRGARPRITGATPADIGYGQTVFVETPDGAGIAKVTFIRLGSVTHASDMGQRLVPLSFARGTGGLSVAVPASRTAAPPGPYMLFLVNGNGVPSEARILRLR